MFSSKRVKYKTSSRKNLRIVNNSLLYRLKFFLIHLKYIIKLNTMKKYLLLLLFIPLMTFGQTTADDYFNRAYDKAEKGDYYGAISDYTKVIEIEPNAADAYANIGAAKNSLKDYYGAISDFNKAIEINPRELNAYFGRAVSKRKLKDYYAAISDYTKVIELDTKYIGAYANRGVVKKLLGDLNGACNDWEMGTQLGCRRCAEWIFEHCN